MPQSTVTHEPKKQPWATKLAQDLHELPLSISAPAGSTHPPCPWVLQLRERCRALTWIWKP